MALVLLVLLAACSSNAHDTSSGGSSGSAPPPGSGSSGPSSTVDPSELSSLDAAGARAFLILYTNQLHRLDPTITQAEIDCVPDAMLARFTPQELFALVGGGVGSLNPSDTAKVGDALRSCGFSSAQLEKARIS
ncbi:MAG: hypothetical protein ACR2LQ_04695 [Acidimicrobiales bacterium]